MIFGRKHEEDGGTEVNQVRSGSPSTLLFVAENAEGDTFNQLVGDLWATDNSIEFKRVSPAQVRAEHVANARGVLLLSPTVQDLEKIFQLVTKERSTRKNGSPVLIVAVQPSELLKLGTWLQSSAEQEILSGIRIIPFTELREIAAAFREKLAPLTEKNFIKMPLAPEVENTGYKYFLAISPELMRVAAFVKELAENNVKRIYLLGGPGIGKTSLAYYYFLCRGKGNFVTINLNAESNADKAAMKSLLCGHVAGAFPGASGREGALSFARDGVCFLDESHGVTGAVMQVLMEALDSGQYLPYGATAKRFVECAVIFASNRKWETLRSMIHIDEHARLGATLVSIPELAERVEDLTAVAGVALRAFEKQCTTWRPLKGFTNDAWRAMLACPWRGNTRTLIRVVDAACISAAAKRAELIDTDDVAKAIDLWEPAEHPDFTTILA